jgi:hypothetical protein
MSSIQPFIDHVGRTIIGEVLGEENGHLKVKNPAILLVQPNQQTGQLSIQTVPLFFKEFITPGVRDSAGTWLFPKDKIVTTTDIQLEERICEQYKRIFTPPAATSSTDVVKLFDD